jgi:hypothetical protein
MMLGLGTYMVTDPSTGFSIDCDSWSNLFNGTCWGYGAAVNTIEGGQASITLPPPGVPAAPTQAQLDQVAASSNPGQAAEDLTQTLTNQAITQTQQNITAANPPDTTPDCSGLLSPFIMPGCGKTFSILPWIVVAGIGVGIYFISKR